MAIGWKDGIAAGNRKIFDGSPESLVALNKNMANGAMLGQAALVDKDSQVLSALLMKTMAAILIPRVWQLSPSNLYPVIIRVSHNEQRLEKGRALTDCSCACLGGVRLHRGPRHLLEAGPPGLHDGRLV